MSKAIAPSKKSSGSSGTSASASSGGYKAPDRVAYSDSDYSDSSSDSETDSDAEQVVSRRQQQDKKKVVKKRQVVDASEYYRQQAALQLQNATSASAPLTHSKKSSTTKPASSNNKNVSTSSTLITEVDVNAAQQATSTKRPASASVPTTGRLVEAAEDMGRWFKGSETSSLPLDDGLTVTQPASNNDLPAPKGSTRFTNEYDDNQHEDSAVIIAKSKSAAAAASSYSTNRTSTLGAKLLGSSASPAGKGGKLGGGDSATTTNEGDARRVQEEETTRVPLGPYDDTNQWDRKDGAAAVPEEGKTVSRADFLTMLDLLGDEAKREEGDLTTKAAPTAGGGSASGLEARSEIDTVRNGMGQRSVSSTNSYVDALNLDNNNSKKLTANEQMHKEYLERQRQAKQDLHSGAAAHSSSILSGAASLPPRPNQTVHTPSLTSQTLTEAAGQDRYDAERVFSFQQTVDAFEEVLTGSAMNKRIMDYLETHHKEFIQTKGQREKGEFLHSEYNVFQIYADNTQDWIVREMKKMDPTFDVEDFVSELFDQEQARVELQEDLEEELAGTGIDASAVPAIGSTSFLGLEAWEVLLSMLQFDSFLSLMDEFINAYYGVPDEDELNSRTTVTGAASALKASSSGTVPPQQSSASSISSSSTGAGVSNRSTPPPPSSSATKFSGLGSNLAASGKLNGSLGRAGATPPSSATGTLGTLRGTKTVPTPPRNTTTTSAVSSNPSALLGQRSGAGSRSGVVGSSSNLNSRAGLREVRNLPKPQ